MEEVKDLAERGLPRMGASLLHVIVMVRGVERTMLQTLSLISMGRCGKSAKVVSVDILFDGPDAWDVDWKMVRRKGLFKLPV